MIDNLSEVFRDELFGLIDVLEEGLAGFEERRGDPEHIAEMFRAAHNLKSAASMMGLDATAAAAHAIEAVLEDARDGTAALDPPSVTRLFADVAALRRLALGPTAQAAPAEAEPAPEARPAARRILVRMRCSEGAFAAGFDPLGLLSALEDLGAVVSVTTDDAAVPAIRALDPLRAHLGFELLLESAATLEEVRSVFLFVEDHLAVEVAEMIEPPPDPAQAQAQIKPDGRSQPTTLAVAIRRVDALVDLAGELAIATSVLEQIRAHHAASADSRLAVACQDVRRLAGHLQAAAMAIRLVPLSSTFALLRRFVREKAPQLGKDVAVEISGGDTELDKAVGERLFDPLKHLVRNALDHGLEPAERRVALGKPARGRIALSARQERGEVVVTVEDDGSGLDLERIRRAARARGLLEEGAELSEGALHDLIFVPGFTTAERVGELSGRGVGLDVVRRNVRELGGEVRVESRPGHGSRFVLNVPLTLAVLEGLIVRCGAECLVIPIDVVRALVRPSAGQIRRLPHGEVLRLAGETVPLIRPGVLFGLGGGDPGPEAVAVIVNTGGGPAALYTDAVLSQEAVMLKSLQRNLRVGEGTLGAAVLGDGTVAVVVDVPRLVAQAAQGSPHEPRAAPPGEDAALTA